MSSQTSFKFNILVVDDDVTCLNIISCMLSTWNYEVFTLNCPLNALDVTQAQDIDLVVTDLYMPKMNGLQLQKQIEVEAKLPVIIMSSDDNEKIILKSLLNGAVFFMSKPVKLMDLKNLWQYAVASKRDKSMRYIEKIGSIQAARSSSIGKTSYNCENNYASYVNEGKYSTTRNKKDNQVKSQKNNKEKVEGENSTAPKKTKIVWDEILHNLFIQAIRHITLEKAVPKNILEYMNVPGLTRVHIASHLQKYRIFLKKEAEKGFGATSMNSLALDNTSQSSVIAGHSPVQNSQEAYSTFKGLEKQTRQFQSFNPTKSISVGGISNNSKLTSFSPSSLLKFGKSHLLGAKSEGNIYEPFLGNTNPFYQPNCTGDFVLRSNDIETNMLSSGSGGSAILMSSTNSMQMPNDLHNNMSTPSFMTSRIWNPHYGVASNNNIKSGSTEHVSFSNPYSNVNNFKKDNYARNQMNDDGNLSSIGGQVRLNDVDGLNGASNLINNGAQTPSLGIRDNGNSNFGTFLAPSESSSVKLSHGNNYPIASFSSKFAEGHTSELPSMAQQQFGLDNNKLNDFESNLINDNDNDNVVSGFSTPQQFNEFATKLMESTDFQFPHHQQQAGEGLENPKFSNKSSFSSETNSPASQSLDNLDFFSTLNVDENHPWDEPSLEQLLEIEELLNTDLLEDNIANPSDDYHPMLNKEPNQQQKEDDCVNSELLAENAALR